MIIEFNTNGNNIYFKSKNSKKNLKVFIKKHKYKEFKLIRDELKERIKSYLKFGTRVDYKFHDDEERIIITLNLINPEEERKKNLKQKLRNRINNLNNNKNLGMKYNKIKKDYKTMMKDKNIPDSLVKLFYAAKADKPDMKIPKPDTILKNKSFYTEEFKSFVDTFKNFDDEFAASLKIDPYTKYMQAITGINPE